MSQEVEMKEREPLAVEDGKPVVLKMDVQNGAASTAARSGQPVSFVGMTKEELMHYANDPFWIRLRWFLFILFWLIWFGMIAGAVLVILSAPKCPVKPEKSALEERAVVYVPQKIFQDATGSGPDFLTTLADNLELLKEKGMEGIWIERFEDLQDPMDIDEVNPAVVQFLEKASERGERVLIEINPNRTPLKHPWFERSVNKDGKYTDYYMWRPSPNNWLTSESGAPSWKLEPTRQENYYFAEAEGYADLNLRNPEVRADVGKVLRFWLDKKAGGFVMSGTRYLYEDPEFKDAPVAKNRTLSGYDALDFDGVSRDLPANRDLLADWKKIIDDYESEAGEKFMIVKSSGSGRSSPANGSHIPADGLVAEEFGQLSDPINGFKVAAAVESALAASDEHPFALWPVAFQQRPLNAFKDKKLVDSMVSIAALLPGAPVFRYDSATAEETSGGAGIMQQLLGLRKETAFKYGAFKELYKSQEFYSFSRVFGKHGYVIVGYFGEEAKRSLDATIYDSSLPDKGLISFRTGEASEAEIPGKEISLRTVTLGKNEVVVLSYEPKAGN